MRNAFMLSWIALIPSIAVAGGPTQGTFEGQRTRGDIVGDNIENAREKGTNYGLNNAETQAHRESDYGGNRDDTVQVNIGSGGVVGYGRNGK